MADEALQIEVHSLPLADLRSSDLNARRMTAQQMKRLVDNIRRDGCLSSAPLVYESRIISGHHRVEAALKAGIERADCMVIVGEVDEHRLTAIQLSHNSIAGFDDSDTLARMLSALPVSEQVYASVDTSELADLPTVLPALGSVRPITVTVTFTPDEFDTLLSAASDSRLVQLEPLACMSDFLAAVYSIKDELTETGRMTRAGVLTTMAQLSQWALNNGALDDKSWADTPS